MINIEKDRQRILRNIFFWFSAFIFSIFYGLQLFKEAGTDFGIYYAGAISTDSTYPLYKGFFETKGPLFYAFIKIISLVIPYSVEGAVAILAIVAFIWFISIYFAAKWIDLDSEHIPLLLFIGISVFVMQPTNGSINVFMCSFFIMSISLAIKYSRQGNFLNLFVSFVLAMMASLTKLDGIIVLLISTGIIIISKRIGSLKDTFLGLLSLFVTTIISLKLLQKLLFFSFSDYYQLSFVDVFQKVWNPTTNGTAKNFLFRDYSSMGILFASGIFFILVSLFLFTKPKDYDFKIIVFLVSSGIFSYLILASDKNYHLFIIYPPLIVSIIVMLKYIIDLRLVKTFMFLSGSIAFFVLLNLLTIDKCAISNVKSCENRFKLLNETTKNQTSRESIYFLNQGWPFVYAQVKPRINFTATWASWNDDNYYRVLTNQSMKLGDQILWVDLNDLVANKLGKDEFISRYFPGREISMHIDGTTFVGLSKK